VSRKWWDSFCFFFSRKWREWFISLIGGGGTVFVFFLTQMARMVYLANWGWWDSFVIFFWKNGPGLRRFLVKNGTVGQFLFFAIRT